MMGSGDERAEIPADLTGEGLNVGLVRARWNDDIVSRLADGARRGLESLEVDEVVEVSAPGCFEVPFAAKVLATSGRVDAIVVVGVVIRGETTHYELVSQSCASGVQATQLETGVPIGFGVLTVENLEQALIRSEGPGGHNVGEEAAMVAVEMSRLRETCDPHLAEGDSDSDLGGSYL